MRLKPGNVSVRVSSPAPSGKTGLRLILFLLIQRLLHRR